MSILCFEFYFREDSSEARVRESIQNDAVDNKFGFERIKGNVERVGWLLNMHSVGWMTIIILVVDCLVMIMKRGSFRIKIKCLLDFDFDYRLKCWTKTRD